MEINGELQRLLDLLEPEERDAAELLISNLDKQRWRLDNLYSIVGASGVKIPFKMNYAQKVL